MNKRCGKNLSLHLRCPNTATVQFNGEWLCPSCYKAERSRMRRVWGKREIDAIEEADRLKRWKSTTETGE